jgi:transcriptional regulator with XRE-family HTH domain
MGKKKTSLGENLQRLRKAAGLSQQALAVAAGLSVGLVSQTEQGQPGTGNPRVKTLAGLARALGVKIDALLAGTEWEV